MLEEQAKFILVESLKQMTGFSYLDQDQLPLKLQDAGIEDPEQIERFRAIIARYTLPVVELAFAAHADSGSDEAVYEMTAASSFDELTGFVMGLSAGKVCLNGHPQPFPYPTICGRCHKPVIN